MFKPLVVILTVTTPFSVAAAVDYKSLVWEAERLGPEHDNSEVSYEDHVLKVVSADTVLAERRYDIAYYLPPVDWVHHNRMTRTVGPTFQNVALRASGAGDVNINGTVVGSSWSDENQRRVGWIDSGSGFQIITPIDDVNYVNHSPTSINAHGDTIGSSTEASSASAENGRKAWLRRSAGPITELALTDYPGIPQAVTNQSYPAALNDNGYVIGTTKFLAAEGDSAGLKVAWWFDGSTTHALIPDNKPEYQSLRGDTQVDLWGLTDTGMIYGGVVRWDGAEATGKDGWVFDGSSFRIITTPPLAFSDEFNPVEDYSDYRVVAMNATGDAIGTKTVPYSSEEQGEQEFTAAWLDSSSETTIIGLHNPGDDFSDYPKFINSTGQVVGQSQHRPGPITVNPIKAWFYDPEAARTHEISVPAEIDINNWSTPIPRAITDAGLVIGEYQLYGGISYAFLYTLAEGFMDFSSLLPDELLANNGWGEVASLYATGDPYQFIAEVKTLEGNTVAVRFTGTERSAEDEAPNDAPLSLIEKIIQFFRLLEQWLWS